MFFPSSFANFLSSRKKPSVNAKPFLCLPYVLRKTFSKFHQVRYKKKMTGFIFILQHLQHILTAILFFFCLNYKACHLAQYLKILCTNTARGGWVKSNVTFFDFYSIFRPFLELIFDLLSSPTVCTSTVSKLSHFMYKASITYTYYIKLSKILLTLCKISVIWLTQNHKTSFALQFFITLFIFHFPPNLHLLNLCPRCQVLKQDTIKYGYLGNIIRFLNHNITTICLIFQAYFFVKQHNT